MNIMQVSTQKHFSYFQKELTAWKSFLILTTSLMLFACNVEVASTNAPENKCAIPDYAEMNPKECGKGAAYSRLPNLSFDGVSTTEGVVGKLITISPSRLETNGSDIKACKITPDLPGALTINSSTCVISGTPTAVLASTTYAVIATNLVGSSRPAKVTLKVGASSPNLSYSGATGTNATVGTLMSVTPTNLSANGASITSCAVKSGTTALPLWASVNAGTCVISGTPNAALASTSYSIVATNSVGQSADAAVTLSVAAAPPTLSYSGSSGTNGTFAVPMTVTPSTLSANGAPITGCSVKTGTPALPSWASLNTTTCVISGTPNAVLATTYTLVATNSVGQSADAEVTLRVITPPSLSYAGASGTSGTFGVPMTVAPPTLLTNGASITSCAIKVPTTALPSWASVHPTTCVISGTPDALLTSTTYKLVATNSAGQSSEAPVTLSVLAGVPTLSYLESTGRTGTFNVPMTVTPSTLLANGAPVTGCAVKTNTIALPAWASVNATCVISGTPNSVLASSTYKLVATNSAGQSAEATVTLSVMNVLTPIAVEAFPDTTALPTVTWTPNVKFSSADSDQVGLYSNTLGTLINSPVMATAGINTFLANPVTTLGLTSTIYAKNPLNSSYTTLGSYQTKMPPSFSVPGTNGNVNASIRDSVSPGCTVAPGCIIIAGDFLKSGGVDTNRISRWNGTIWSSIGAGMNGNVNALAIDNNGHIYAGGSFTVAGGVSASNIAKWNGTTWTTLGTGIDGEVRSLAIDANGNLYVGGSFTTAGGVGASRIAKWNSVNSTWSALGTGLDSIVNALALDANGNLYAGGGFDTAGGVSAKYIARWNPTILTWSSLGTGLTSGTSFLPPGIYSLTFDPSGNLYAGGIFNSADGVSVNNIAKWNPTISSWTSPGTGLRTGGFGGFITIVKSLAIDSNGNLYAGGQFTTADGVSVSNIARWNLTSSTWGAIGTGLNGVVNALAIDGSGNLYAGGSFTTAGGMITNKFSKWNGINWSAVGAGMNNAVSAIAHDVSGNLYVGGNFTTAGDVVANRVARWNSTAWSALGGGLNDTVNAMITDSSNNLYVGGSFTTAGGVNANRIARWTATTSTWSALGTGLDNTVNALVIDGNGNLYAGGSFTTAGGVSANRIARWNPTTSTWSALGTGLDNTVNALVIDGNGNLYAGGSFTTAGGASANRLARWNPATSTWSALGVGLNNPVNALAIDGNGNLYAGGSFTAAGTLGSSASYIAMWNPANSTWNTLDAAMNEKVNALAIDGNGIIYAGGDFTTAGGVSADYIAAWNPTSSTWSALGTGMTANVTAIAVRPAGDIFVGGGFFTAGSMFRPYVARWVSAFNSWF